MTNYITYSIINLMSSYWYYLTIGLQIITVIHAVRTGRTQPWLYIIIFLPLVGCLVYFYLEILPDIMPGNLNYLMHSLKWKMASPEAKIARLEEEIKHVDTNENRVLLADAYIEANNVDKAIGLYLSSLKGLNVDDPFILNRLAAAYMKKTDFLNAKKTYLKIKEIRKGDWEPAELFFYTRVIDELDEVEEAHKLYKTVVREYASMEGDYYFVRFLKKHHFSDELADQITFSQRKFDGMLNKYKREGQPWMKKIAQETRG